MHFSCGRVYALIVRYWILQKRDFGRIFDVAFWPVLDCLIFGFISHWMHSATTFGNAAYIPIIGLVFWNAVVRTHSDLSMNIIEELWSKNMVGLFSSPLTMIEWLCASMIVGMIRSSLALLLCSIVVWCLYGVSIGMIGLHAVYCIVLLYICGWFTGLLCASLVIIWGQQVMPIAFANWVLTPLCGVFTPVAVLPPVIQYMSGFLPMTPIFATIQQILVGEPAGGLLWKSVILLALYIPCAYLLFTAMFSRLQKYGLARLEAD